MRCVLEIGNCSADYASLRQLVHGQLGAELQRAATWAEAQQKLKAETYDLILVNRILDEDGSDGLDVIRKIKEIPSAGATPVMMITNYSQYQDLAVEAGGVPGFGKSALQTPATVQLLQQYLG